METVWITGATGAIGSALARRFDARGVNVVLSARDSGELEALAAELSPGALSVVADATDASSSPNVLKMVLVQIGSANRLKYSAQQSGGR
jgi:NADP-dependent 3-hydroxy acid dehydrogenase YdfG